MSMIEIIDMVYLGFSSCMFFVQTARMRVVSVDKGALRDG